MASMMSAGSAAPAPPTAMADAGSGASDNSGGQQDQSGDQDQEAGETSSVFLSQEALGGKKVKAGDTITLTVQDVDPETGDVQAQVSDGDESAMGGQPDQSQSASDFDTAMGPEQAPGA